MDIYFCLSYLSVPHTITLIRNTNTPDFKIVTSNNQIYKFFDKLFDKDKITLIPSFSYTIPLSKGIVLFPIKLIWIWRMKHKTWNRFKGIENQNVYFFFNASAYSHAWIIYKLSKRNTIFYQEDTNLSMYPGNVNLKTWINKQFLNLVYKLQADPIDLGNGLITYKIKTKYFTKVNAESLKIELNYKEISKWVNNLLNFPRGDILLLTGLMAEFGLTVENYIKWSDILIAQLKKCGYTVHFKMHVRQSVKYSLEKTLYEVPKYLPASLLLHYKIYISYMSSALTEAANNDILAISLINYFPSNKEERKENFKNTLKKNLDRDKVIYYPPTLSEILNIIDNIKIPKQTYYDQKK